MDKESETGWATAELVFSDSRTAGGQCFCGTHSNESRLESINVWGKGPKILVGDHTDGKGEYLRQKAIKISPRPA
ncbi:MAG: hypothetical protein UW28_C0027G0011 [Parcubacteria group bacterium GW2011_GWA2_44_13]|nr:MAG: hypothetical protein UW28_C0027G0011 [Parcubacteria group bacterium GW2011_GWA2_44_13]